MAISYSMSNEFNNRDSDIFRIFSGKKAAISMTLRKYSKTIL